MFLNSKIIFLCTCIFFLVVEGNRPADGKVDEVFTLANKMLDAIKRKSAVQKSELNSRFVYLEEVQKNGTDLLANAVWKEIRDIRINHTQDSKSLVEKLNKLSADTDKRFEATKKSLDQHIVRITFTQGEIRKLSKDVTTGFSNNTSTYNAKVKDVETKIAGVSQSLSRDINGARTSIGNDLKSVSTALKNDFDQKLAAMQQQLQNIINDSNKPSTWPAGSYCIFKSGPCPAGFTAKEGQLLGLNIYSPRQPYIKAAHFGDSNIKCHGSCGQYGNYAELKISTCCK